VVEYLPSKCKALSSNPGEGWLGEGLPMFPGLVFELPGSSDLSQSPQ
jgi:hypothetical protein